jgi:hypothetical protein
VTHDLSDSAGLALASRVIAGLKSHFAGTARLFMVKDLQEDQSLIAFSITFEIYDFYAMIFNYDRGFYGFAITYGTRGVDVLGADDVPGGIDDLPAIAAELDRRVRLRIPDKYLESYSPPAAP